MVKTEDIRLPEMLMGYLIGPFGALLSSGIFTSMLQNYFTDVLRLDLSFLTGLQMASTILIVAANLVVGQMIERTKAMAGKARPWILLSALTRIIYFVVLRIACYNILWYDCPVRLILAKGEQPCSTPIPKPP